MGIEARITYNNNEKDLPSPQSLSKFDETKL